MVSIIQYEMYIFKLSMFLNKLFIVKWLKVIDSYEC